MSKLLYLILFLTLLNTALAKNTIRLNTAYYLKNKIETTRQSNAFQSQYKFENFSDNKDFIISIEYLKKFNKTIEIGAGFEKHFNIDNIPSGDIYSLYTCFLLRFPYHSKSNNAYLISKLGLAIADLDFSYIDSLYDNDSLYKINSAASNYNLYYSLGIGTRISNSTALELTYSQLNWKELYKRKYSTDIYKRKYSRFGINLIYNFDF